MSALGLLIIVVSLLVSVGISVLARGQVVLVAWPLMIGLPLNGLFARHR